MNARFSFGFSIFSHFKYKILQQRRLFTNSECMNSLAAQSPSYPSDIIHILETLNLREHLLTLHHKIKPNVKAQPIN